MIILDTNVISELMREEPDTNVKQWIADQPSFRLATSSITIAEIMYGIKRLPVGKRQQQLEQRFKAFMDEVFIGRIFGFDEDTAYCYGQLMSDCEKKGHNADTVDIMIAAIAKVCNASLATRNTKDFIHCGIQLVNPFNE